MPTLIVLVTSDDALAAAWEAQLPPGRTALRLAPDSMPGGTSPGFAAVVILDAAAEPSLPPGFAKCPTIYVGEARSVPFEQARMAGRAKVYLTYDDSTTRLADYLPLVEEVAEKQSMLDLLIEKVVKRGELPKTTVKNGGTDPTELWDFLEGAVENLDSRERLIAEFRRASRPMLHASHAVFFLRESDMFRADRGTSSFAADDPLVAFFENHPAVIDGAVWSGPVDPTAELAVRNRLALWGARLLVPIHDNGRLLGLIALGVRDDGQPYDETDRNRAIYFARLLRHFLAKAAHLARLSMVADQAGLGAKYLPSTLVLGPEDSVPRQVPLVVRDLIGRARRSHEVCRVSPAPGQPFRASAGPIAETRGIWAFWEEASGEVHDATARQRAGRRGLIRELGLTLSHELGNSLVSLSLFKQSQTSAPPPALIETIRGDIQKLEGLNQKFHLMQILHEAEPTRTDICELAKSVGSELGLLVEVLPEPVYLHVARNLVEFALRTLIQTVTENRPQHGSRDLELQVRSTGEGKELTALLSIKGKHLELEGIMPEPTENAVPNQGRIGVFIAKEVLRLHNGEIHAGPGIEGAEILLSLRSI